MKLVLDIGSGPSNNSHSRLRQSVFPDWKAVRYDIDPTTKPDIVGSIVELGKSTKPQSFDAIWSSHVLEHLETHRVQSALDGCRRALRNDGFAIITCPDLMQIAKLIVAGRGEGAIYNSPAGPITCLDMLFGHNASIAAGRTYMAHRTAFVPDSLTKRMIEAGFAEVWTAEGRSYDIWAIGFMPNADRAAIKRQLAGSALRFLVAGVAT